MTETSRINRGGGPEAGDSFRVIGLWLFLCAAMIFAMAMIGAITRLTESGLSIMEWAPVSGALPPLSKEEWTRLFQLYQQVPEYSEINQGMKLEEFKTIFWWEYVHRLWGRLTGLLFALPFAWFWIKGKLPSRLKPHLVGLLFLGGLQGALGWYMVSSGFANRTDVSQYRLTAHLMAAVLLYSYIMLLALGLWFHRTPPTLTGRAGAFSPSFLYWLSGLLVVMALITITSGGLVAGLNAGLIYNSFPLMDGQWFPSSYWEKGTWLSNSFESVAAVQFHHRVLAVATGGFAVLLGLYFTMKARETRIRIAALFVLISVLGQIGLGVATLLLVVPIALATAHQGGSLIFLTSALYLLFEIHRIKKPSGCSG